MKAIFFGCLVAVFASCSKPKFDFNMSISPDAFTEVYSWGDFRITGDSSNKVSADIVRGGISSQFSAIALNATFSRNVFTGSNDDSSVLSISAFDPQVST